MAIRYRVRNYRGETLESIMEKGPLQYIQGSGAILPSLENELLGMEAGAAKTIAVPSDDLYVDVVIDAVRQATEQEIRNNHFSNLYPEEHCGPDCIC